MAKKSFQEEAVRILQKEFPKDTWIKRRAEYKSYLCYHPEQDDAITIEIEADNRYSIDPSCPNVGIMMSGGRQSLYWDIPIDRLEQSLPALRSHVEKIQASIEERRIQKEMRQKVLDSFLKKIEPMGLSIEKKGLYFFVMKDGETICGFDGDVFEEEVPKKIHISVPLERAHEFIAAAIERGIK